MAKADDVPNLVRVPFPDASEKHPQNPAGQPAMTAGKGRITPLSLRRPRRVWGLGAAIADILLAAPTPGSSWAMTKRLYFGFGGKSVGRSSRRIYRPICWCSLARSLKT